MRVIVPGSSNPYSGYLKITFHADAESTDLIVYAQGDNWPLPKSIWQNLAAHIVGAPIKVTVQTPGGGATSVSFQVAPVGAGGSMVFWSANPTAVGKDLANFTTYSENSIVNDSYLDGFTVGDVSTIAQSNGRPVLQITDVQQPTLINEKDSTTQAGTNGATHTPPRCIGCHVGTPDGDYVAFVDFWPWSVAFADVSSSNGNTAGSTLPGYSGTTCTDWNNCTPNCNYGSFCSNGKTYIQEPWGGPMAFSQSHWNISGGERLAVMTTQLADPTNPGNYPTPPPDMNQAKLIWVDTTQTSFSMMNGVAVPQQGVAWGLVSHTGDLGGAAFPTWSNDGNTIVYSSSGASTAFLDGRLNLGKTDLYQVPWGSTKSAGGTASPVPGASTTQYEEYYPAFAPDDSMLAYTAVPSGQVMYANPKAELYVVPFPGDSNTSAIRMAANDPPTCTNLQSPGINNHWPKWSPTASTDASGNTYYWIIFSSNRYNPNPMPVTNDNMSNTVYVSQLYITAVVKADGKPLQTFPAIYLYNQPPKRLNTTPAWQDFNIPIVIDRP